MKEKEGRREELFQNQIWGRKGRLGDGGGKICRPNLIVFGRGAAFSSVDAYETRRRTRKSSATQYVSYLRPSSQREKREGLKSLATRSGTMERVALFGLPSIWRTNKIEKTAQIMQKQFLGTWGRT